jgi:hypothetical protein
MKISRRPSGVRWKIVATGAVILAVIGGLLLFKLGSLTGGLTSSEIQQQTFSSSWRHIARDPLNLPLTAVQWLLLTIIPHHGRTITRLPSAILGIVALVAFYYIIRRWYSQRTALFGIIVFGCSSWFLHASRLASTEIVYLWAVPTLLAILLFWEQHRKQIYTSYFVVAVFALLFYVPGMQWLILIVLGLQPHHLTNSWKRLSQWWQKVLLPVVFIIGIIPLILALLNKKSLAQTWLGLPQHFDTATHVVHRLAQSVSFAVFRGPIDPALWLDRLPILDIFCIVMALTGLLFYLRHFSATRSRLLLGLFIVAAVLFSLGGPVGYSILVPLWYLLVTGGIGYLLHEWLRVFPQNPIARGVGYGILSLTILLSCSYNLRAYFVAWPHSQTTIATFTQQP